MSKLKSKVLMLIGGIYLIVSIYQIWSLGMADYKNKLTQHKQLEKIQDYAQTRSSIVSYILENLVTEKGSKTDIIKSTMAFVYDNSLHLIDEEHKQYAFNIPVVLKKMDNASKGDPDEKPHLSCGPRAYAMRNILQGFNIKSRLVQIYSDEYDTHEAHRFLEVYNTDTKRWETWDPDFGVAYVDSNSRKPVDIMRLVFGNIAEILPVGLSAEGWEETATSYLKEGYFEAVRFEQPPDQVSEIIVNTSLFNLNKRFSSTGLTFKEWAKSVYHNPRIITLPGNIAYNDDEINKI